MGILGHLVNSLFFRLVFFVSLIFPKNYRYVFSSDVGLFFVRCRTRERTYFSRRVPYNITLEAIVPSAAFLKMTRCDGMARDAMMILTSCVAPRAAQRARTKSAL